MQTIQPLTNYRKDIDGLRAFAVLAVIAFHFGYLPAGYLGVDVFFVISGYLISGILFSELVEQKISLGKFYLRRTRRIIPLVLFVTVVVLLVGFFCMLPDDLENLSASIVATNFFSNNILQIFTTKNYWDIHNEFKPLVHTWSLGIEEQFYLFYPFIFLLLGMRKIKLLVPLLFCLSIISILLFLITNNQLLTFYLIPFRFFELSLGGLAAVHLKQNAKNYYFQSKAVFLFIIMVVLLFCFGNFLPNTIAVLLTVIVSLGVITSANNQHRISSMLLENKVIVMIGKISFSLYLWHQPVIAFTRYVWGGSFLAKNSFAIFLFIVALSFVSYFLIEQPFRNKEKVKAKALLCFVAFMFLLSTGAALYVYLRSGIVRNVPELDIRNENVERNMHAKYNDRIYKFDKKFTTANAIKILVVGNSEARDWANVLMESTLSSQIELSYTEKVEACKDFQSRCDTADFIFVSTIDTLGYNIKFKTYNIDSQKVKIISLKSFGKSNGIFYNKKRNENYCNQRVTIDEKIYTTNENLKKQWRNNYIDLLRLVIDDKQSVNVFTPNCKFISQDCIHFTKNGAVYFAQLLDKYFNDSLIVQ